MLFEVRVPWASLTEAERRFDETLRHSVLSCMLTECPAGSVISPVALFKGVVYRRSQD